MAKWHPENLRANALYDIDYSVGTVLERWRATFLGTKVIKGRLHLSFYTVLNVSKSVEIPVAQIVNIVPVIKKKAE